MAIALGVMAGEDEQDFKTIGSSAKAQTGSYTKYLNSAALKGKRFGVPAFIFTSKRTPLQPETKTMLLLTIERPRGGFKVLESRLMGALLVPLRSMMAG